MIFNLRSAVCAAVGFIAAISMAERAEWLCLLCVLVLIPYEKMAAAVRAWRVDAHVHAVFHRQAAEVSRVMRRQR